MHEKNQSYQREWKGEGKESANNIQKGNKEIYRKKHKKGKRKNMEKRKRENGKENEEMEVAVPGIC